MSSSLMGDAFAHHAWATMRVMDACGSLGPQQLEAAVPGTYGSILQTMRHLVGSDSWYLIDTGGERAPIDTEQMDLQVLRAAVAVNGAAWARLLAQDPDPDAVLREVDDSDGYVRDAPVGIRLAQALHHGTDHRSQICTALTSLGVEPPGIDVWDYGVLHGRIVEIPPT